MGVVRDRDIKPGIPGVIEVDVSRCREAVGECVRVLILEGDHMGEFRQAVVNVFGSFGIKVDVGWKEGDRQNRRAIETAYRSWHAPQVLDERGRCEHTIDIEIRTPQGRYANFYITGLWTRNRLERVSVWPGDCSREETDAIFQDFWQGRGDLVHGFYKTFHGVIAREGRNWLEM